MEEWGCEGRGESVWRGWGKEWGMLGGRSAVSVLILVLTAPGSFAGGVPEDGRHLTTVKAGVILGPQHHGSPQK